MTARMSARDEPVVVLGSHRSGTSAVTGLLASAGLRLGPVIPPGADNPRGYFESAAVLSAHESLLHAMERDWTCPPPRLPASVDLGELQQAVAELREEADTPWGVKDPRMLFLLGAWTSLVPAMRFVGVVRHPSAISDSLQHRNRFDRVTASAIAAAYTSRLAALHRALKFPVIDFDADGDELLARVSAVAAQLDLAWDDSAARTHFAPEIRHHDVAADGAADCDDYAYLVAAAGQPITDVRAASSEQVVTVLDEIAGDAPDLLPLLAGPMAAERATASMAAACGELAEVHHVVELRPPEAWARGASVRDVDPGRVTVAPLGGDGAPDLSDLRASHVLGVGVLEAAGPAQWPHLVRGLERMTGSDAVAVFDGLILEGDDVPTVERWDDLAVTSRWDRAPFHVHIALLDAATIGTPWRLVQVTPTGRGRSQIILRRGRDAGQDLPPPALRTVTEARLQRLAALEADLAAARAETAATEARVAQLREQLGRERVRHHAAYTVLLQDNAALRAAANPPAPARRLRAPRVDAVSLAQRYASLPRWVQRLARLVPRRLRGSFWSRIGGSP